MRLEINCLIILFGFSILFIAVQSKQMPSILYAQEGQNSWLQAFIPRNGKARGLGSGLTKLELLREEDQNVKVRCAGKHLTSLTAISCNSIDECIRQIPCLIKRAIVDCDGQVYEGTSKVGVSDDENFVDEYQWTMPKNFPSPGHGMVACKAIDTSHPYKKKMISTLDIFFTDNHGEIKLASSISEKDLTAIEVNKVENSGESTDSLAAGDKIQLMFWTAPFFLQNDENSTQVGIKWVHKNGSRISIDSSSTQKNAVENTYTVNDLSIPKNIRGISLSVPWRPELAQKGMNDLIQQTLVINVSSSNEQEEEIPKTTDSSITTTFLPMFDETIAPNLDEDVLLEE